MLLSCLLEVSAGILLSSLSDEEERGGVRDVEGSDHQGFQGIQQGEVLSFHERVLLEQILETLSGVLGSVQLTHGAMKRVVPPRLKDEPPVLLVKLTASLRCKRRLSVGVWRHQHCRQHSARARARQQVKIIAQLHLPTSHLLLFV